MKIKCEGKSRNIMDKKMPLEDETRKLIFVVIYMSLFVLVLFGLGPLV